MFTNTPFWSRVVALAIGYVVMLVSALSIFTIPFYTSLAMVAVGAVIILLSDRTKIPMTRISWIVLLAVCVLIPCALNVLGQERIEHWRPFPAGYVPAWFVLFHGFRHVRYLILHFERSHDVVA